MITGVVPLNLRRINHHNIGNYADYLDELIGRKLYPGRDRKTRMNRRYRLA